MSVAAELRDPFPPEKVKQRDGRGGLKLDYIAGEDILERYLNTSSTFTWDIQEVGFKDESVFIVGRLTVLSDGSVIQRDGVGASQIRGELDDAIKTANTEAFKNAAKHYGTGLYLWFEEEREKIAEYRKNGDELLSLKKAVMKKAEKDMGSDLVEPEDIAAFYDATLEDLQDAAVLRDILEN